MNRKLLSTAAFMLIFTIASFANNRDAKPSSKEAQEFKGITNVQVSSTKSTETQTCTVTLSSWIKFGMMQIYYTVSASADNCTEAAKSASNQMNEAKNFLNYTIIE